MRNSDDERVLKVLETVGGALTGLCYVLTEVARAKALEIHLKCQEIAEHTRVDLGVGVDPDTDATLSDIRKAADALCQAPK